ncbi:RidA family protein [Flintibacter sp. P01028]|uniref:RidA family protein n=1 Tax=Flintibacter sp. P01028 TaxID=3342382 RepID=UPI0035B68263
MNKYSVADEANIGPAHGPYSQGIVCEHLFYTGVIGSDGTGEVVSDSVYEQTIRIFENTESLLKKAGGSLTDIINVTVYLLQMSDFDEMNRAYKEKINVVPLPARATVAVHEMLPGVKVEMIVTAYLP